MTISLNFEYQNNGESIATYRGFTVRVVQDQCAENPFENWDCEPPIAVVYRGDVTEYGNGTLDPLACFSDGLLSRHWRKIARALNCDPETIHSEGLDVQRSYDGRLVDIKREAFNDILGDMVQGNKSDYFAAIASLFGLAGIEALDSCATGYSQGNYVDILAVATPAWVKKCGAPRASHASQLAYAVKLYGYWAFGDCYGYVIESEEGDHLDSCFGFYGPHDESGLVEQAADMLAYHVAEKDKANAIDLEASRPDMYKTLEKVQ